MVWTFILSTLLANAVTIEERITNEPDKVVTEVIEVPTKKLVHQRIVSRVHRVLETGIPVKWQDGARRFLRHNPAASDNLDIKRMRFVDRVVTEIEVVSNIIYSEGHNGVDLILRARCEVFLEKDQGIFDSNYFLCVNENGEEIEWER